MGEMGYFEAYDAVWTPLTNSVAVLDLLARLEPTGVLEELRGPTSPAEVAARAGLDSATVATMLEALELSGVVERSGEGFVLAPAWKALTGPGGFAPLRTLIAAQGACSQVLRTLGTRDYWELDREDRLAMARAVSPDPFSDEFVAAYRSSLEQDPVGRTVLGGGRFLELGCGVAGRILTTLRAAPGLTAVGVELSEELATEAERRASELGLSDRFTVVCGDAADYVADEPFDFGFWSQFFFPDDARGPALAVMMASLRPGASFQAPVGVDPDVARRHPETAKDFALWHTMLRSWGIPERTVATLRDEVVAAGFVDVEVVAREVGPAVRGRRP